MYLSTIRKTCTVSKMVTREISSCKNICQLYRKKNIKSRMWAIQDFETVQRQVEIRLINRGKLRRILFGNDKLTRNYYNN